MSADPEPPAFTVFTPTYNRAHTLGRVYDSLCRQTLQDFEWIVVDDGSTDETPELVRRWANEARFCIRYLHQQNAGKHVAHNRAVREAAGRLFLVFDSDDSCVPRALERFWWHWTSIPETEREAYYGVTGLCADEGGAIVGDRFPKEVFDSDSRETYYRFRIRGEKWGCGRVDVLREYLFPEEIRGVLVPEELAWFRIASRYRTRYINECLRIYHRHAVSLSASTVRPWHHAAGRALAYRRRLEEDLKYVPIAPVILLGSAALYVRLGLDAGRSLRALLRELHRPAARALVLVAAPVGVALYLMDAVRRRAGR